MGEQVAVEGVQGRIVEVGFQDAFGEVVQDHGAGDRTQAAEGLLVQLRPDALAGAEGEQADGFAAVAQGEDEHAGAPVTARFRMADHGPSAVVDLQFLAGRGEDDRAGLGRGGATQLANKAFDALVTGGEAVVVDQVLVNRLGVAALAEREFDEIAEGLAGAGGGAVTGPGKPTGSRGTLRWPALGPLAVALGARWRRRSRGTPHWPVLELAQGPETSHGPVLPGGGVPTLPVAVRPTPAAFR